MSEFRKVAKGAIWVFSVSVLTAVFAYLSKVLLARILGPAEYGLFVLSMTIAYIFSSFAQSGVAPAISYFVPKYRKSKKLPHIISTLFWIISIFLVIIGSLFLLFPTQIAEIFGEPKVAIFLPYVFLFLVAYTFTGLLNSIFRSYENAKIPSLVDLIRSLAFLVLGVGLTYLFTSALTPILAYIFIYVGLLFSLSLLARKLMKFKTPSRNYAPEILLFSLSMFFVGITILILRWTDVWMISRFMSSEYVGIYNAATSTAYLLAFFINAFMFLYFPIATKLLSKNKKKEIRNLATKVVFWNTIVVSPIFFLMFAFSKQIINVFFGSEFLLAAVPLSILSFGLFFRNVVSVNGNSLLASGRKRDVLISAAVSAALNVVLNYFLIPIYGISGAAVATTISMIVNFSLRWIFARKQRISPNYFVVIKPIALAFALFVPLYLVGMKYSFDVVSAIFFGILYILIYFILVNKFIVNIKGVLYELFVLIK